MDDTQLLDCTQALPEGWDDDGDGGPTLQAELVAWLQVGETEYEVFEGETKIGRDPATCQIVLSNKVLSKQHAIIEVVDDTHTIADLGSMNKTRIGKMILKPEIRYALQGGETLRFGDVEAKYSVKPKVVDDSGSETGSESMLTLNDSEDSGSPLLTHQLPGLDVSDPAHLSLINNQSNPENVFDNSTFVPETQEDKKKSALVESPSSHLKSFVPETPSTSQSTPVPQKMSLMCISETPANVSAIQKDNNDDSFFFELSQPEKEKKILERDKKCHEQESEHEYNSDASTDIEEDDIPTQLFSDCPSDVKKAEKKVSEADNDIFLQATQAYSTQKHSPSSPKPSTSGVSLPKTSEDEYDNTQEIMAAFEKHENESPSLPVSKDQDRSEIDNDDDDDFVPTQLFMDDSEDIVFKKPVMVAPKSRKRVSDPTKGSKNEADLFEEELMDMPTQPYIDDTKARPHLPCGKDLRDAPTQEFVAEVQLQKSNSEKKAVKGYSNNNEPVSENQNKDDIEDIFNQPTQLYSKDDVNEHDVPTQPFKYPEETAKVRDGNADDDDDNTEDIFNQPTQPYICTKSVCATENDTKATPVKRLNVEDDDDMTPTQLYIPHNFGFRTAKKLESYVDDDDLPPTQLFSKQESAAVSPKRIVSDDDLSPTQLFTEQDPVPAKNRSSNDDDDLTPTQLFVPKDSARETLNEVTVNDDDDDDLAPTQLYSAFDPVQNTAKSPKINDDDDDDDDLAPTQLFTHDSPQFPKKSAIDNDDDLPPTQVFTHETLQKPFESPKSKYKDPVLVQKCSQPPIETKLQATVNEGDEDLLPTQLYHADAGKLVEKSGVSESRNIASKSSSREIDDSCYDVPTQPFLAESEVKSDDIVSPKKIDNGKDEKIIENANVQRGASEVWDAIDADETQDINLDTVIGIDETSHQTVTQPVSKLEEKGSIDIHSDAESDASETLLNDNSCGDEESDNELQSGKKWEQIGSPLKSIEKVCAEEENYHSDESTDIEGEIPDPQNKVEAQSSPSVTVLMHSENESHVEPDFNLNTPRSSRKVKNRSSPVKFESSPQLASSPNKRIRKETSLEGVSSSKALEKLGSPKEMDSSVSAEVTEQTSKISEINKPKYEFRKVFKSTQGCSQLRALPEAKQIDRQSTPDSYETEDLAFLDIQFAAIQDTEQVSSGLHNLSSNEKTPRSKRTVSDLYSDSDSDDENKFNVSQKLFELTPVCKGNSSGKKMNTSGLQLSNDEALKRKLPFDDKSEENEGFSVTPGKKRRGRNIENLKEGLDTEEETSNTNQIEGNETSIDLYEDGKKSKVSPNDNQKASSSIKANLSGTMKEKQNSCSEKIEKITDDVRKVDDESDSQKNKRNNAGRSRKRTLELVSVAGDTERDVELKMPKIKVDDKVESLPKSPRRQPPSANTKGEQSSTKIKTPKSQAEEAVQESSRKSRRIKSSVKNESDESSTSAKGNLRVVEELQKSESVPRPSRARKSVVKDKDSQRASLTRSSRSSVAKETDTESKYKGQAQVNIDDSKIDASSRDSSDIAMKAVTVDDIRSTRRRLPRTYSSSSTVSIQSQESEITKSSQNTSASADVLDTAVQGKLSRRSNQKDTVNKDMEVLSELPKNNKEAVNNRGKKRRTFTDNSKQESSEIADILEENKNKSVDLAGKSQVSGRGRRSKQPDPNDEKIQAVTSYTSVSGRGPLKMVFKMVSAGNRAVDNEIKENDRTNQASTSTSKEQENLTECNESFNNETSKVSHVSQRKTGENISAEHSDRSEQEDTSQDSNNYKPKETRLSRGKNKRVDALHSDLQPVQGDEEKSMKRKNTEKPVNENNSQVRTSGRSRREPRRFSPEKESENIVSVSRSRRSNATKPRASTSLSQNSDDVSVSVASRRGQQSAPDEEVEFVPARAKSIHGSNIDTRDSGSQDSIAHFKRGRRTTVGKLEDIAEVKSKGRRKKVSDEALKPESQQVTRRGRASIATSQPSSHKPSSKAELPPSTVPKNVEKVKCWQGTRAQKDKDSASSSKEEDDEHVQQEPKNVKGKSQAKRKSRLGGLCKGNIDAIETKAASDTSDRESENSQDSFKEKRKPKAAESLPSTPKSASNCRSKRGSLQVGDKVLWSPSQRQQQASTRPRVLFTGYKDLQDEKIVTDLGGKVVESACECTVLVTTCVRRTCKLLAAMGKGMPIVTPSWLVASKQARNFVDPWEYIVKDAESETKYGFRLEQSLRSASKFQLFEGLEIHATKSVKPPPEQMKEIIECSGGTYLDMPPKRYAPPIRIVSCPEDKGLWPLFRRLGIPILGTEFILTGLLRHQLLLDDFEIK